MARAFVRVLLLCVVATTVQTAGGRGANVTTECVDRFDPAVDYFPDKRAIEDAVDVSVQYRPPYKGVTVIDATAGGPPQRNALATSATPAPQLPGQPAGARG